MAKDKKHKNKDKKKKKDGKKNLVTVFCVKAEGVPNRNARGDFLAVTYPNYAPLVWVGSEILAKSPHRKTLGQRI